MSDSEILNSWEDYWIELLEICAGFAEAEKLRERLKEEIERKIAIYTRDEHGKHTVEALLKLLLQLVREGLWFGGGRG